ncbi:MAG TPA: sel1 repeat family protein [Deltaproteobacteria bacterium]|nr:sel1 repeat family protein [Deltaproteobacteria bacterium]
MLLWFFACSSSPTRTPGQAPPVLTALQTECDAPQACAGACDAGEALACNQLGLWLHDGLMGATEDRQEAAVRYRRACDLGAGIGCYNLAGMVSSGDGGLEIDPLEARLLMTQTRQLYQASCDAGALTWCVNLAGLMIRDDLGSPDPRAAVSILQPTCDGGYGPACVELARLLLGSRAGRPDPERAEALLTAACDDDVEGACNDLALQLERRGEDAVPVLERACDRGVPIACRNLAKRVPGRDRALALLSKACDAPKNLDGLACSMAAEILLEQPGNEELAIHRLARSCSVGIVSTCMKAVTLAAVTDSSFDKATARDLVARGCALGDASACELLERLDAP